MSVARVRAFEGTRNGNRPLDAPSGTRPAWRHPTQGAESWTGDCPNSFTPFMAGSVRRGAVRGLHPRPCPGGAARSGAAARPPQGGGSVAGGWGTLCVPMRRVTGAASAACARFTASIGWCDAVSHCESSHRPDLHARSPCDSPPGTRTLPSGPGRPSSHASQRNSASAGRRVACCGLERNDGGHVLHHTREAELALDVGFRESLDDSAQHPDARRVGEDSNAAIAREGVEVEIRGLDSLGVVDTRCGARPVGGHLREYVSGLRAGRVSVGHRRCPCMAP